MFHKKNVVYVSLFWFAKCYSISCIFLYNCWLLFLIFLILQTVIADFGRKSARLTPNGTNLRTFRSVFSTFWLTEYQIFVPFGLKLTYIGPKSDITDSIRQRNGSGHIESDISNNDFFVNIEIISKQMRKYRYFDI